jgi:hypothetical protein
MREKKLQNINQLNVSRKKDVKDGRCEGSGFPICQNGHQKAFLAVRTEENWNSLPDSIKAEVRAVSCPYFSLQAFKQ